jgi:HK97 gp10 family phage protein
MAQDIDIKLLGQKELEQILKKLPDKLTRKFVLASWRKSAKPIINAAKNNIKGYSKSIASTIGNITGRSKKYPTIYVGPRAKAGKNKDKAWLATIIEYGASGTKTKSSKTKRISDDPKFAWVGKIKRGQKYRQDQPARPFMRPAILNNQESVKNNFFQEMKVVLQKQVNKYNKFKGI